MARSCLCARLLIAICSLALALILACGAVADRPLTLGVLAWRDVSETTTRWRPLADYLSVALGGRPVRLVAAGFPDLSGQLDRDELDFVLTNPSHYILLRGANRLSGALATSIVVEDGHSVSAFGGVILTLAGRHDIARIQDLDGRAIAAVAESSLGGWQAQLYELSRRGVRPPTGDRLLLTGMPHDRVVEAVLAGSVDAGFVRTGLIEAMARQGTLDPTRIKVVEPQDHPGFPLASSTRLFPEWPFVALPHVDHDVARRVAAALLLRDASHPAGRQADIGGFGIPADYGPVEDMARLLRLPPHDAAPAFTMADVFSRFLWQSLAVAAAVASMAALLIALMLANRRLAAARAAADRDSRTLADERRRLAEVIWGTNVGTWEWNVATGETIFNQRWAEIVGRTLDELAPVDIETWSRLVHPDDLKRSVAALERHFAGQDQYYECEARMRHASGRWVWVLDRGKVVEWSADGKPLRMSGTHLDISERKDAELAERQTAHRLEVILDSVSEGIYGIDSDGRTTFVNRAATRMLGWTREEMLGAGERQPNRKDEGGEAMFLRKDGTSFPAEYVSSPAVDPDVRVSGAVVVFRNVGERTKLLHNLERSNAELEQFAYVVSHDLRQPLRMINSYSTLLARRLGDGLDAEGRELLHFVCEGAIRMDRMLISLLEYSRVGRKGQPMDWIDSGAVLDEALLYLKPDTDELGAEISVEGEMPTVFASRDEMTRLFQNLLGNAIKYRAADRRPQVSVSVAAMPGEWVFAVRDNGIGIAPRQFGRLFQVFQRLHGQGEYEGTGIGLAVCRKIVERHGGRVWVESPGDGAGSTFLFTLPRCPPAAVVPPPSSERIVETVESPP